MRARRRRWPGQTTPIPSGSIVERIVAGETPESLAVSLWHEGQDHSFDAYYVAQRKVMREIRRGLARRLRCRRP